VDENQLRYEGWRVAAVSASGLFLASMLLYTFGVLLKPFSDEFSWSRESVSRAYGITALMSALSAPLIGMLLDRLGPRKIVVPCLTIFGCAFASLAGLTSRLWHLYLLFAVLGVVATGLSPIAYSRAVSSWFDRRRGLALAIVVAGAALGAMVHPPAMQALMRVVGWRGACLVLGGIALAVGLPLVVPFLRERPGARSSTNDAGAGASVREGLGSRSYWTLLAVLFASSIALNGAIVHLSAILTDRGVSPRGGALAVSAMGVASLAGRLSAGFLLDRFAAPRVSFALLSTAALGTLALARAGSFASGALAAALIGFGMGGEFDVTPYLLSRYFGLRSFSTLYGIVFSASAVAGAIGPILLGRTFDRTGSYEALLLWLAFATFCAGALMLTLPRYTPR
jgi:predicted MFS family arabinose efflux permease